MIDFQRITPFAFIDLETKVLENFIVDGNFDDQTKSIILSLFKFEEEFFVFNMIKS
tara:strand:- start:376 stop:543 length:168 start_codon:yes stop_codon:yes gene_type:complete